MSLKIIIRKYIKEIIILSIAVLISTILNIISPFILERALDSRGSLVFNLFIYFLCLLLSYFFSILFAWLKKTYSIRIKTSESLLFTEYISKMKYIEILRKEPTYLVNRMEEAVANIYSLISEGITQIATGMVSLVVLIILIQRYSNFLMFLYITYSILSYFGYKFLNKILLEKSKKLQDIVATNYKNVLSFMTNVDFLKLLPKFSYISPFLKTFFRSSAKENANVGFYAESISVVLEFILTIIQSSIYVYIFIMYGQNKITFAQVAVIVLLNNLYKEAMSTINNMNINLRDVRASMDFINTVIIDNLESKIGENKLEEIESIEVIINNISYDDNILIRSGTFKGKKGDIIGLSGESGTGKSTLLKYLLGLYENEENKVLYNGVEISNVEQETLKEKVMYISQNPAVFSVTLRDNFLISIPEHLKESKIRLDEVISYDGFDKFKAVGLDTLILEGGSNLSGGDKQKIAIGRALLKNADLLVLDEFSNSIDSNTEKFILNKIKDIYKDKIVILITHNSNLIENCNTIYAVKDKHLSQIK